MTEHYSEDPCKGARRGGCPDIQSEQPIPPRRRSTVLRDLGVHRATGFSSASGGLRAIFTPHLHLAITAYSQRIPTFSLYVREKTKRFCDRIGQPERAQDLSVAKPADFKRFIAAAQSAMRTDQDEETLQRLQGQASSVLAFLNQERTRGRVTYPVGPKFTVTSARFATPVRQLKSIRS